MGKELGLTELKRIQLDILKDVDAFCKLHNLRYSLAYGTLLGAVRHKGFIPWDDDIDIMMPREDYQRFMETYSSEKYQQKYKYDKTDVSLPFGKVYDTTTVLIENVNNSDSPGVFIDVFPIDREPSDITVRKNIKNKIRLLYRLKVIKNVRINKNRSIIKNTALMALKVLTSPFTYCKILKDLNDLMIKSNKYNSETLTDYNDFGNEKLHLNKDAFDSLVSLQFEDSKFLSFFNYDEILRMMYGDYMKLPPEEKQITHHGFKAYHR